MGIEVKNYYYGLVKNIFDFTIEGIGLEGRQVPIGKKKVALKKQDAKKEVLKKEVLFDFMEVKDLGIMDQFLLTKLSKDGVLKDDTVHKILCLSKVGLGDQDKVLKFKGADLMLLNDLKYLNKIYSVCLDVIEMVSPKEDEELSFEDYSLFNVLYFESCLEKILNEKKVEVEGDHRPKTSLLKDAIGQEKIKSEDPLLMNNLKYLEKVREFFLANARNRSGLDALVGKIDRFLSCFE
jgi:hypothetical protein